jgi:hypothetical protein
LLLFYCSFTICIYTAVYKSKAQQDKEEKGKFTLRDEGKGEERRFWMVEGVGG